MGARYKAVLNYLGHEWAGDDLRRGYRGEFTAQEADRILICTPTDTHIQSIIKYRVYCKPILCEKPITTDIDEIELLADLMPDTAHFEMVDQYAYLCNHGLEGETYYNYFKHGSDGLYWDCINLIKHARGQIYLLEESPVWTCRINGGDLKLSDIDMSYVRMISRWLRSPKNDVPAIIAAHKKVAALCAS
jgi:hypothetical protein